MEYSGTAEEGHRISDRVAIGWLANDRIKDPLWKNLLQQIAEFYCIEAEIHGYEYQFYHEDPAELCRQARDVGCTHVLILKIGLFPVQLLDYFTSWFENYYNGEVFYGHVLDKGDLYYEIHPQCMLVDVNWFCEHVGVFEQRFRGRLADFVQPQRSAENFHNEYTPKWVKQGEVIRTYEGTCWGWNIVEEGLQTETGIGIWPQKIRDTYHYAYGEVEQDYIGKKAKIISSLCQKESFYIANTEDFKLESTPEYKDHEVHRTIYCTAGGMSAPFLAYQHFGTAEENQKLVIMDRSMIAIGMSDAVWHSFKPTKQTYKQWCRDYFSKYKWMKRLCQGVHNIERFSDFIDYHEGFKEYFEERFKTLDRDYEEIDLLDFDDLKMVLVRYTLKEAARNPDTQYEAYINLSNIFHFYQTAAFHNTEERIAIKNKVEEFFREINSKYHNVRLFIIGARGAFNFTGYVAFSEEGAAIAKDIFPWT